MSRWADELKKLPDTQASNAACRDVVFGRGFSASQRAAATRWLIEQGDESIRDQLAAQVGSISDWTWLDELFAMAAQHGWREYLGPAAAHYGRMMTGFEEMQRPERAWITGLAPGMTVEAAMLEVFLDEGVAYTDRHRLGAWSALNRLLSPEQIRAHLAADHESVWAQRALAAWRDWGVWPRTGEGLGRVSMMPPGDRVDDSLRAGLRVYHLPLLALPMAGGTWDERLVHALRQAMDEPSVVAAWFAQADADRADTTTEHGGLLLHEADTGWIARAYPSLLAVHDRTYVPPPSLVLDLGRAVAHYHFHAQPPESGEPARDRAAPSAGDLRTAARLEACCLVLAFKGADKETDLDTLTVTWYTDAGGGYLGEVRRREAQTDSAAALPGVAR